MKKGKCLQLLLLSNLLSFTAFVSAQELTNITKSFIGNTFTGANGKWVSNHAEEVDIASDGTMITGSDWDEAGRTIGVYKDGQLIAHPKQFDGNGGHVGCSGWGTGGSAIAVDDNYLYVNNCAGQIMRFNRANNYSYVDLVNTDMVGWIPAQGMTVSGSFLYLILPNGMVQKRSVSNLGTVSLSFTVTGGWDIAVDNTGNIWVLTATEVLKYSPTGVYTGVKIAQSGWQPRAVNYDAFNNLLLVPDNGPRRQVIKFNTSGVQVGTFGDLGGISAGIKGVVGDLRFWNIAGAGTDASGNMYVALDENCVSLRKFSAAGVKQWEVLGTMFTDIASIDPASDGADIYSVNERYKFNYTNQQWSMQAMTVDRINYPDEARSIPAYSKAGGSQFSEALMRRVNGNLLMFLGNMFGDGWVVYRFDGEIAVMTDTLFGQGPATFPDKNGNIWYEEEQSKSIKKIPLTGFSANGSPIFGAPITVTTSRPAPFDTRPLERLVYDVDTDVMYIGGWTNANQYKTWGLIGSTIARFPNWSTGNRTASHTLVAPLALEGRLPPKAMSVAGDYIFVGTSLDRGKLYVFNSSNLTSVGFIAPPTDIGELGWVDLPDGIQAFKRSNGQYVILVEENSKGKNVVYQWCPTGDCSGGCATSVDSVTLNNSTITLEGLTSKTLVASVFPDTVCLKEVFWKSKDESIVKVDNKGVITSLKVGSTWVKATSNQQANKADSCLVTVSNVAVSGITFEKDSVKLPLGTAITLKVYFLPTNAVNRNLTWKYTVENIVSVNDTGLITGLLEGSTHIIASSADGNFRDTCFLEVIPMPIKSLKFKSETVGLWVGDTQQMIVEILPEYAANKSIEWLVLDQKIASVTSDGIVKAISIGETKLIATSVSGGIKDTCLIKVIPDDKFANSDIGDVCTNGSYSEDNGLVSMTGSGADIYGFVDAFHYAYTKKSTDIVIIARVNSMLNTSEWAKAGVMIRESLTEGSKHVNMVLSPGNGTSFQYRYSTDNSSEHITPGNGAKFPYWVKLVKQGDTFSGYSSPNGVDWVLIGSTIISMSPEINIGLCLTAHEECVVNTAKFDHVIVSENLDTIPNTTAINVVQAASAITLYPNPATDIVYIDLGNSSDNGAARVQIVDLLGKQVYLSGKISQTSVLQLNTSQFEKGIYFVNIINGSENICKKLIIQ